jgi:hypothetical protein
MFDDVLGLVLTARGFFRKALGTHGRPSRSVTPHARQASNRTIHELPKEHRAKTLHFHTLYVRRRVSCGQFWDAAWDRL